MARDEGISPPITGVSLVAPCVVHWDAVPEEYKSMYKANEQCKNAPLLDMAAMEWFIGENALEVRDNIVLFCSHFDH